MLTITDEAFQQFMRGWERKLQLVNGTPAPLLVEDSRDYITCGHCRCVSPVGAVCAGCGRSL